MNLQIAFNKVTLLKVNDQGVNLWSFELSEKIGQFIFLLFEFFSLDCPGTCDTISVSVGFSMIFYLKLRF